MAGTGAGGGWEASVPLLGNPLPELLECPHSAHPPLEQDRETDQEKARQKLFMCVLKHILMTYS